jgi:ATP-dependent protease ClpP protease subunit
MAAIIHQYGAKRMMADRSILMFHDAAGGVEGTLPQMMSRLAAINSFVTKMDSFIAARSGQKLDAFLTKIRSEVWLDAEDSTAQHYNDEIVSVQYEKKDPGFTIFSSPGQHNVVEPLKVTN